ncbi:MAG: 2'-5' RNA ligase family protein [Thermoleophilia bacterium]
MNPDHPAHPARTAASRELPRADGYSFRLFLAVELPAAAIGRLIDWQEEYLAADEALRLCPPEQLHITLVFLGQVGETGRERAAAALQELEGARAFEAAAAGIVGLPVNSAHAAGYRCYRRRALRASERDS